MVRIASYNVENLFARPKAFDPSDWSLGQPALDAYYEVNGLIAKATYSATDRDRIRDLLVELDIYTVNANGAKRRKYSRSPRWAWLRKNRGKFDREPNDNTQDVEIIATGRDDWIGWVELAIEATNELSTRLTARVIQEVNADIIGIVEAEDRPSLVRFNDELLGGMYEHVMLVDGNDTRGIDVGIMTKAGFEIESVISNVDTEDSTGTVFSRDCPQYTISCPSHQIIHVLVNHFKSQSGGGGSKRQRQSAEVVNTVDELANAGERVVVCGDLNEGPPAVGSLPANLAQLFNDPSRLVDCYSLPTFQTGPRLGTFNSCGIRNRLDYMLISPNILTSFTGGEIFRKGLWGTRITRPTDWVTYPDMTESIEQASDHAAIYIDLNI
jgi:endonuclease/exonuclease/phosphatase family metal-dependent hydrolase